MSEELKEWYNTVPYEEIKNIIRDRMSVMAREYVGIGFYLRRVRDNEMYLEDGYKDVHEFAMAEFGMSRSTVNHCIRINEQFSMDGNSPTIDNRYKDFSKSQLQEMLYLPDDKRDDVTPDMTVKEIRNMKDDRLDVEPKMDSPIPGQMVIEDSPECMPEDEVSMDGPDQTVTLRKPTQEEKNILAAFARKLIRDKKQYFLEDFAKRVTDVTTSGMLLYQHLGFHRTWYFKDLGDRIYHINLFENYIQLWLEGEFEAHYIGDFDWFYLMAQVQPQWNIVAMEEADKQVREQIRKAELTDDESIDEKHGTAIDELNFSVRTYNVLKRAGVDTIEELQNMAGAHLIMIRNMSRRCIDEVRSKLEEYARNKSEKSVYDASQDESHGIDNNEDNVVINNEEYVVEPAESVIDADENVIDVEVQKDPEDIDDEQPEEFVFKRITAQSVLKEARDNLDQYLDAYKDEDVLPEFIEQQKIIVNALAAYVNDLEEFNKPEPVQPELIIMKNNDQRKAFLDNYQTWPVWFEVPEASEVYHRFDLPDGSSIVICEYHLYLEWRERYTDENPNSIATREYLLKPGYHYLHDCLSNRTALVDHLKEAQKK